MLDTKDMATPAAGAETALRDAEGAIHPDYVERVNALIRAGDAASLQALCGDLHESDTGDLIEALDPELRPRFVELLGGEFDFTALTEVEDAVREEILDELPAQTVAEGVRELDSDDAAYILEDLPKAEQVEILEQLPRLERVALERILHYPAEMSRCGGLSPLLA
jgi:magnesium transporter